MNNLLPPKMYVNWYFADIFVDNYANFNPHYSISRRKFVSDSSDVNLIFSFETTILYIIKMESTAAAAPPPFPAPCFTSVKRGCSNIILAYCFCFCTCPFLYLSRCLHVKFLEWFWNTFKVEDHSFLFYIFPLSSLLLSCRCFIECVVACVWLTVALFCISTNETS